MRLLAFFALTTLLGAAEPFQLMQNLDGDLSFTGDTPQESKAKLEKLADDIASGPAKSLMWSIGAGSDILYYPTKVASTWGWRVTKYNDDPKWKTRIERCRVATEAGLDAPRIVGERAKQRGMAFYPSYRMNDAHYCSDPLHYPLTGRFWMEHQEASLGASPVPEYDGYKHLLNFARELTLEQRQQIEIALGKQVGKLINQTARFDDARPYGPQCVALAEQVGLTAAEWETLSILVNPPGFTPGALCLLSELHGRMGYFPAVVRLRPVNGSTPPCFELAEIMNLQALRNAARERGKR